MSCSNIKKIKQSFASDFSVEITDCNWQAVDLTPYDGIDFIMADSRWAIKVNTAWIFIGDKTLWKVWYNFSSTDTDTVGIFNCYFALKIWAIKKVAAPVDNLVIQIIKDFL